MKMLTLHLLFIYFIVSKYYKLAALEYEHAKCLFMKSRIC